MSQSYTNIIDDLRLLQAPLVLPWWAWTLLGLLVAGLGYLLWWRAHRPPPEPAPSKVVARIAYEDALAELEKMRKKIATENSRAYAIGVSGITRRYIERRFAIRAPRLSTEEFLAAAKQAPQLTEKYQQKLGHFLGCCDFLKFARGFAEVPELELLHNAAVAFVTETWVPPDAPPGTPAAAPSNTPAAEKATQPAGASTAPSANAAKTEGQP